MKPRVAFIPADKNNLDYAEMLINSIRKFHNEDELPIEIIGEDKVKQLGDPNFWYRSTPIIAKALFKDYETVIKLDADQICLGDLSHVWSGNDFDVACVYNSNPREDKAYPIRFMDVHPFSYVNCGFVVLKSKAFVEQWLNLCMSEHFNNFQYREQDLLNLMVWYMSERFGGPYKVKFLDEGPKWHGLIWRQYEPQVIVRDNKLILPKNDEWNKEDKELVCWHAAGGQTPNKMNYRTRFQSDVIKYINSLVKP